jgi:hypothetical protein
MTATRLAYDNRCADCRKAQPARTVSYVVNGRVLCLDCATDDEIAEAGL